MADPKTVGILTFHDTVNYGGVLQCLALQEVVSSLGWEPRVIDYRGERAAVASGGLARRIARPMVKWINWQLGASARRAATDAFANASFAGLTKRFDTLEELRNEAPDCRAYIVGSDQVWNPFIVGRDPAYFLQFGDPGIRKLSYAASIGLNALPPEYAEDWAVGFRALDAISVREESAAHTVRALSGREAPVVLDPTLLLGPGEWERFVDSVETERYLLVYVLPGDSAVEKRLQDCARSIAGTLGLRVIRVGERELRRVYASRESRFGLGPAEFLKLLFGASYVVTNSFHGCAFSINLGKPFTVVTPSVGESATSRSGRLKSLLERLGLAERQVHADDISWAHRRTAGWEDPSDVIRAAIPLRVMRVNSIHWLAAALGGGE